MLYGLSFKRVLASPDRYLSDIGKRHTDLLVIDLGTNDLVCGDNMADNAMRFIALEVHPKIIVILSVIQRTSMGTWGGMTLSTFNHRVNSFNSRLAACVRQLANVRMFAKSRINFPRERDMVSSRRCIASRHFVCGTCSSWVEFDSSWCTNSWAEMRGGTCVFACKGCREVSRLVGEVEDLRLMMVPAWCDFCCCKQNCHYCIGIMMFDLSGARAVLASGRPALTRDIIIIHFVNNVVTKIRSPNHVK